MVTEENITLHVLFGRTKNRTIGPWTCINGMLYAEPNQAIMLIKSRGLQKHTRIWTDSNDKDKLCGVFKKCVAQLWRSRDNKSYWMHENITCQYQSIWQEHTFPITLLGLHNLLEEAYPKPSISVMEETLVALLSLNNQSESCFFVYMENIFWWWGSMFACRNTTYSASLMQMPATS